jgi:hypothetical protein
MGFTANEQESRLLAQHLPLPAEALEYGLLGMPRDNYAGSTGAGDLMLEVDVLGAEPDELAAAQAGGDHR